MKNRNALEELELWNRKHYFYSVYNNGNIMPGDSIQVTLKSPIREVTVNEIDLYKKDTFENGDFPSISDVILATLDKWNEDQSIKLYKVLRNLPKNSKANFSIIFVEARNEKAALNMVHGGFMAYEWKMENKT